MLFRVIKYYDNPNNVTINTLDKYEISSYLEEAIDLFNEKQQL